MENVQARERLAAMAAFGQKTTGLPGIIIWIIPGYGDKHGPRIKVSNLKNKARFESKDCFSVSVPRNSSHSASVVSGHCELPAKELKQVLAFVNNNVPQLLSLWLAQALPEEVDFVKS